MADGADGADRAALGGAGDATPLVPVERAALEAELETALAQARAQLSLIRGSLATIIAYEARPS